LLGGNVQDPDLVGIVPSHAQQGITIFSLRPCQAIVAFWLQPGTKLSAAVTL
jgi:hypothetical protein